MMVFFLINMLNRKTSLF